MIGFVPTNDIEPSDGLDWLVVLMAFIISYAVFQSVQQRKGKQK